MEGEISFEVGMNDWIMASSVLVGWVDGLHTGVEAKKEVAEVESYAQAIGYCNLLPTGIKTELTTWLLLIVADGPNVTGIDEESSIKLPEHVHT